MAEEKKLSQADAIKADQDNVAFLVSKMLTFKDVFKDARYIVVGLVQFMKIWFALRLIKSCDSIVSFIFLSYADTFVSQIYD